MKKNKFNIGDTVYLNKRAPESLRLRIRERARHIVDIIYEKEKRCCYYYLGENNKAVPLPWLRSYMLRKEKIGHRQRTKRKYTRRTTRLSLGDPVASQGAIECKGA